MGGRGPSRSTDQTQTSVRPRTWQSGGGGGGGRAAPRVGQIGVPAPPPDRGRWYAGAIGARSPHGPSRSTDPTQTSLAVRPRTWQSAGGGGRAAPRVGQIGVPAPLPDRGRWYAGAIGAAWRPPKPAHCHTAAGQARGWPRGSGTTRMDGDGSRSAGSFHRPRSGGEARADGAHNQAAWRPPEAAVTETVKPLDSEYPRPAAGPCRRPGPTGRCRHRAHGTSAADCRRRFAHRSSQSGSTAADVLLRVVPAPVPTQCHCRSS
jgi:hypothetical protein